MVQFGQNTTGRIKKRIDSVKTLVRGELDLAKGVLEDVKERINLDAQTEPQNTKNLGGIAGQRGSLIKTPIKIISGTVDNLAKFVQDNATITREILRS